MTAPARNRCGTNCRRPSPSQAHCAICHHTFGGVYAFDQHRRGGECRPAADLGLSLDASGVWRFPPDEANAARLAALSTAGQGGQS